MNLQDKRTGDSKQQVRLGNRICKLLSVPLKKGVLPLAGSSVCDWNQLKIWARAKCTRRKPPTGFYLQRMGKWEAWSSFFRWTKNTLLERNK